MSGLSESWKIGGLAIWQASLRSGEDRPDFPCVVRTVYTPKIGGTRKGWGGGGYRPELWSSGPGGASLIPLSDRPTTSHKTFSATLTVVINLIVINRNNLENIYESVARKGFIKPSDNSRHCLDKGSIAGWDLWADLIVISCSDLHKTSDVLQPSWTAVNFVVKSVVMLVAES